MMNETGSGIKSRTVQVTADNVKLEGKLSVPTDVRGIVLFAHGSGSSRFSLSNRHVAELLQENHFATLLFELLTPQEEELELTCQFSADVELIARRIVGATDWVLQQPTINTLPLGYFGVSTGADAALTAATQRKQVAQAVVAHAGFATPPAMDIAEVQAATLLIADANDEVAIDINRALLDQLQCKKELAFVPVASLTPSERKSMTPLAELALNWFQTHLCRELLDYGSSMSDQRLRLAYQQHRTLQQV